MGAGASGASKNTLDSAEASSLVPALRHRAIDDFLKELNVTTSQVSMLQKYDFTEDQMGALEVILQTSCSASSKNGPKRPSTVVESELVRAIGGHEHIKKLKSASNKVYSAIQVKNACTQAAICHDKIYQGTGLQKLLNDGAKIKPVFDKFCEAVAERWTRRDLATQFINAPVKSLSRSDVKVRVAYNGQVTMLSDAVRGTMKLIGEVGPETMQKVYDELLHFVHDADLIYPGVQCKVLAFKDRYQQPAGEYRDFLFKLKINEYLCELQVNFSQALELKEMAQHKKYELERMAEDNLLAASMAGDRTAVLLMLKTGVRPLMRDSCGCTPLHYAAFHGDSELCEELLKSGADSMALDATGALPLHRAASQGDPTVTQMILDAMMKNPSIDVKININDAITTAWEVLLARKELEGLQASMLAFMKDAMHQPEGHWLLFAARNGCLEAVKKLAVDPETEVHCIFDTETCKMAYALDVAIKAGSSPVVQELIDQGFKFWPENDGPHHHLQTAAENYVRADRPNSLHALQLIDACQGSIDLAPLLPLAAAHGALDTLEALLRQGVQISGQNEYMESRLKAAASDGCLHLVELMLDALVDVNTAETCTPIYYAAFNGEFECAKFLMERKADPTIIGCKVFESAIDAAVFNNRINILRLFHEWKVDLKLAYWVAHQDGDRKPEIIALISELLPSVSEPFHLEDLELTCQAPCKNNIVKTLAEIDVASQRCIARGTVGMVRGSWACGTALITFEGFGSHSVYNKDFDKLQVFAEKYNPEDARAKEGERVDKDECEEEAHAEKATITTTPKGVSEVNRTPPDSQVVGFLNGLQDISLTQADVSKESNDRIEGVFESIISQIPKELKRCSRDMAIMIVSRISTIELSSNEAGRILISSGAVQADGSVDLDKLIDWILGVRVE